MNKTKEANKGSIQRKPRKRTHITHNGNKHMKQTTNQGDGNKQRKHTKDTYTGNKRRKYKGNIERK